MNNVKFTRVKKPGHVRIEVNGQIIDASHFRVDKASDGCLELHLVLPCDSIETVGFKKPAEWELG